MMWDFLSKAGDFMKDNSSLLQGLGAIGSAYGNYYGAKQQAKANEKNYQLNLSLLNDERKRRREAQNNLNLAWAGSMLNPERKKDEYEI